LDSKRHTIRIKKRADPVRYAYVEFAEPSIVQNAVVLNESTFRGRLITVCPFLTLMAVNDCRPEL
jgi:polyadenylate-binding protein 2